MDDQQGHVIDGTARARHWRGSKPKTGSAPEAAEARSDAPKSFAGSLLVPADMLPAAFTPDERSESQQGRAAAPPTRADADPGARTADGNGAHQNPFLVPEAARVEPRPRSTRRRMIAALLASPPGLITARPGPSRGLGRLLAVPRWAGALRLTRLLALAALTGAVVVTAVIATRANTAHPSSTSALGAAGPLGARDRGSLTAVSNPFAQQAATRGKAPSRRVRPERVRPRIATHQRRPPARKPAVVPAQQPAVVPARYTPPISNSGSSGPSSTTSSYAVSTPTTASSQPAASSGGATTSSSSSGSSRPAFGENGTLGPGRGAPGTQ